MDFGHLDKIRQQSNKSRTKVLLASRIHGRDEDATATVPWVAPSFLRDSRRECGNVDLLTFGQKSDKSRTKVGQKSDKSRTKIWNVRTKIGQKSDKSRTKSDKSLTKSDKIGPKDLASGSGLPLQVPECRCLASLPRRTCRKDTGLGSAAPAVRPPASGGVPPPAPYSPRVH